MPLQKHLLAIASAGALLLAAPVTHAAVTLTVRASGTLAGNVGPIMEVRLNGSVLGKVEVRSPTLASYGFSASALKAGDKLDVVFTNDAVVNGQDRNLSVAYLQSGSTILAPNAPGAVYDRGVGTKAFDGLDVLPGTGALYFNGALRMAWPAATAAVAAPTAAQQDAARLLQQASFGPTLADINRVASIGRNAWVAEQLALPRSDSYQPYVQSKYDLGAAYRPGGAQYSPAWLGQRFWANAANSPDQLRKRTAFALQQVFTVSLVKSDLWGHARAYARYLDQIDQHALGNYRNLLQDMALSPVMGIYLSHLRNRRENPATGLLPDENFAREVMQLFSIGLRELNVDGSLKLGADGKPIETYSNADVMAMAKVFTGWSWGFADAQLTENNFRWGSPDVKQGTDQRVDVLPMKAYPGQHSTAEKRLFAGKPWAVTIPANTPAADGLRMAMDALFKHPNVGPFLGRQLIQHLVSGNPSPAYVARVAAVFNNNGQGVRGDLAAVVRAVLTDAEARGTPTLDAGKLREPVLRVAQWMRALNASSTSGQYMMAWELRGQQQQALYAPSVFGFFRPGYVPPNTRLADAGVTAPEFQIVDESSTADWVNQAERMASSGMGWTGSVADVRTNLAAQVALVNAGNVAGLVQNLNLLLFAGRMSAALQADILDAVGGVGGTDATSQLQRAQVALYIALASPEYLVQR